MYKKCLINSKEKRQRLFALCIPCLMTGAALPCDLDWERTIIIVAFAHVVC